MNIKVTALKASTNDKFSKNPDEFINEKQKPKTVTKTSTERKRVVFDCPVELHRQLKMEAVRREVSMRELIVAAIETALLED